MYVECVKARVENSVKADLLHRCRPEDLAVILAMAAAVAGGEEQLRARPFLIHYSEPTPPLALVGALDKLFFCAEKGIPVTIRPRPCSAPAHR